MAGPRGAGFMPPFPGRPATTPVDAGTNRVDHCRRFIDNAKHVLFHLRQLKQNINSTAGTSTTPSSSTAEQTPTVPAAAPIQSESSNDVPIPPSTGSSQTPETAGTRQPARPRAYPASEIVTLHRALQDCQTEMQEYVIICDEVMANPTAFTSNNETRRTYEKMIHGLGEATHFLSHAQHSLSDLFCDLSQEPCLALAVPTPMNATMTGIVRADVGVGIPGQPQVLRFPMAPSQFVDPFVPPHQRPAAGAGEATATPTQNGIPEVQSTDTDFSARTSQSGGPPVIVQATFRSNSGPPTTLTSTATASGQQSSTPPSTTTATETPPSTTQSQNPIPQPGVRPRGPQARMQTVPRDPYVPCSSRFFHSAPANAANRVPSNTSGAATNSVAQPAAAPTGQQQTPDTNGAQNTSGVPNQVDYAGMIQDMLGGQAFSVEVNENMVAVDPNRPIGEQLQDLIRNVMPQSMQGEGGGIMYSDVQVDLTTNNENASEEHDGNVEAAEAINNLMRTTMQQLSGELQQATSGPGPNQGAQTASPNQQPGAAPAPQDGAPTSTLFDFIQTMQTQYNVQDEGSGVVNDLLTAFSRGVTVSDLFLLINGDHSPLVRSRPHLIDYVRNTLLMGESYTRELLASRITVLLEGSRANIATHFNTVRYVDNVDGPATATQFIGHHANILGNLIADTEISDQNFSMQFYGALKRVLYEFLTLFNSITSPSGQVDRLFTTGFLTDILGSSQGFGGPAFENMISMMMAQQISALASTSTSVVPVSEVQVFIVRGGSQNNADSSPMETSQSTESNNFPQSSLDPEPMETDDVAERLSTPQESVRPKVNSQQGNGDSSLTNVPSLFNASQIAAARENMKSTMERDLKKQQSETYPTYFSDAYLLGMPARHRQAATMHNNVGMPGSLTTIVSQVVRNSPNVNTPEVLQALNSDPELVVLYQQSVREDIGQRATTDSTLQLRPSTKKWIDDK